jgi:hypothetical protein
MAQKQRPPRQAANADVLATEQRHNIRADIAPQAPAEAAPTIVTLEEARRAVHLADSYTSLPTIFSLFGRMETYSDWLTLLGYSWTCCDNVSAWLTPLRIALPSRGPVLPMMTEAEQAAYDALPDKVTIYRGQRRRRIGICWSLDRSVAERFPFYMRYSAGIEPVLLTAEVRKRDVLAIKLDRGEAEAIVLRGRRILSRQPIEERAAA